MFRARNNGAVLLILFMRVARAARTNLGRAQQGASGVDLSGRQLCGSVADIGIDGGALCLVQAQAQFRAPPEIILTRAHPFTGDSPIEFPGGDRRAKALAHISLFLGVSQ